MEFTIGLAVGMAIMAILCFRHIRVLERRISEPEYTYRYYNQMFSIDEPPPFPPLITVKMGLWGEFETKESKHETEEWNKRLDEWDKNFIENCTVV